MNETTDIHHGRRSTARNVNPRPFRRRRVWKSFSLLALFFVFAVPSGKAASPAQDTPPPPDTEDGYVWVMQKPELVLSAEGEAIGYASPKRQLKRLSEFSPDEISEPAGFLFELDQSPVLDMKAVLEARLFPDRAFGHEPPPAIQQQIDSELAAYREGLLRAQLQVVERARALVPGRPFLGRFSYTFNGFAMDVSQEEAESIQASIPEVRAIWPNQHVQAFLNESVPYINADDVWSLDADGQPCAVTGKPCLIGQGVTIGIIDTGVDYTHPDLGGCLGQGCKVIGGYDFVNEDEDPADDYGHGTHVAAIAAGDGTLRGVAPGASIVAYKVLDEYGSGTWEAVIAALERAVDPNQDGDTSDHLDVVNLSLGGSGDPDDPASRAVDRAAQGGVVVVVAAGNWGPWPGMIGSPGTARRAITVGASWHTADWLTDFSSRGPTSIGTVKPDLTAPGDEICAARSQDIGYDTCLDERHVRLSGTSMATPHVAGVAALLLQKQPTWSPDQIKYALRSTAVTRRELGNPNETGHGRVDALAAASLSRPPAMPLLQTYGEQSGRFDIRGELRPGGASVLFDLAIIRQSQWLPAPGGWKDLVVGGSDDGKGVLLKGFESYLFEGANFLRLAQRGVPGQISPAIDYAFLHIDNFSLLDVPTYANRDVTIRADVRVPSHDGYRLESSADGQNWVTLIESGHPLPGQEVGIFPATSLPNGLYQLRLSLRWQGQWIVDDDQASIRVVHELKSGWPQTTLYGVEQALVFDVDGDGALEIVSSEIPIYSDDDYPTRARMYLWETNGALQYFDRIQWPRDPSRQWDAEQSIFSVIQDGPTQRVVHNSWMTGIVAPVPGSTAARYLTGWPQTVALFPDFWNPLIVIDLDSDGQDELVGSYEGSTTNDYENDYLMVYEKNGARHDGFPLLADDELRSYQWYRTRLGVADFDNDGSREIAFVTSGSKEDDVKTVLAIYENDGRLRLARVLLSTPLPDPQHDFIEHHVDDLAIGDLNGDGVAELVVLVTVSQATHDGMQTRAMLFVLNGDGEPALDAWPKTIVGVSYGSLALANMDGGQDLEIVVSAGSEPDFYWSTTVFKANGLARAWPRVRDAEMCGMAVGDVDADGTQEVVSLSRDGWAENLLLQVHDASGIEEKVIKIPFGDTLGYSFCEGEPPVITDLDRDGRTDVLAYGDLSDWHYNNFGGVLLALDLGTPYDAARMEWPQWAHDNQGTQTHPIAAPRPPQCSDGLDNDLDGAEDYPADPGCLSAGDDSEDSPQLPYQIYLPVIIKGGP